MNQNIWTFNVIIKLRSNSKWSLSPLTPQYKLWEHSFHNAVTSMELIFADFLPKCLVYVGSIAGTVTIIGLERFLFASNQHKKSALSLVLPLTQGGAYFRYFSIGFFIMKLCMSILYTVVAR